MKDYGRRSRLEQGPQGIRYRKEYGREEEDTVVINDYGSCTHPIMLITAHDRVKRSLAVCHEHGSEKARLKINPFLNTTTIRKRGDTTHNTIINKHTKTSINCRS